MTPRVSIVLAIVAIGAVAMSRLAGRSGGRVESTGSRPQRPPAARSIHVRRSVGVAASVWRHPDSRHAARAPGNPGDARWATSRDLRPLVVSGDPRGRLVVGEADGRHWRHHVLAAEPAQSVAVIGPTQSGKTTAVAIPAILAWDGPVLAASVKTDLVRDTLAWRRSCGTVWCFDPAGTTGLARASWSPVSGAGTWKLARQVAADLTEVTRGEGTSADGEFWYATAAKLLAPLLFAAATGGRTIHDVMRWVDTQETEEVLDLLHVAGVPEALQAARATWLRDERQRSGIYTTAETVLEPFAEPDAPQDVGVLGAASSWARLGDTPPYGTRAVGGRGEAKGEIDPGALLSGANTIYVCAPAHDQRRLRAVFVALVEQVLHAAFAHAARAGRPLDPPLLVVLDEAANIAPLKDLDGLAATCAGHGVQLVTVWQDLAQVRARYGERAATVVNNHRAKLFLPGIADPGTLDFASHLAGEHEHPTPSVTFGARGERTVTRSSQVRPLLPPDTLRRLPRGSAVMLYGALPPTGIRLRPWFCDRLLTQRGGATPSTGEDAPAEPRWCRWLARTRRRGRSYSRTS